MIDRDKDKTSEREKEVEEHAENFAPFCQPRGTLGLGLPNEGLGDRIRKQLEDERRNR